MDEPASVLQLATGPHNYLMPARWQPSILTAHLWIVCVLLLVMTVATPEHLVAAGCDQLAASAVVRASMLPRLLCFRLAEFLGLGRTRLPGWCWARWTNCSAKSPKAARP